MNYKDTLNLPKTSFPMKANLPQNEPSRLKYWQDIKLYQTLRTQRQDRQKFILHDGPPYANGNIHIGHAVNKILKDIIIKSQTLNGLDAPYVPGWDCHGLPIELQVEKKHGKVGNKIDQKTFRKFCRDYATKQINRQREDFIRLGIIGDWENPYKTMDFRTQANSVRAFAKMLESGYIYKGLKPVHWCIHCSSALAEAEVEYQEIQSDAIDVSFGLKDKKILLERLKLDENICNELNIVIWTTTPWTLPANQAVAINKNFEYVLVKIGDHALILEQTLHQSALTRYQYTDYKIISKFYGATLTGAMLRHPFYDRDVPIIESDHVNLDQGTGAVHIAPGHGQEDYVLGIKQGLAIDCPVNQKGYFQDDTSLYAGQHVHHVNPLIIKTLTQNQRLLSHQLLQHSYPHCWRHKIPLIFRATAQWFIGMDKHQLRNRIIKAIETVQWLPDWNKKRIYNMVETRPDWCISRQRTWGNPLPLFLHRQTAQPHPKNSKLIDLIADKIEQSGLDGWFESDHKELLDEQDIQDYQVVTDTLDVWFDSGITHTSIMQNHPALGFPADVYIEGSDQHRGWFQSSLITAIAVHDAPPYRQVITHGFTVDANGMKMSKSKGNVVAPQQVVKTLGADILRLWVAATDYRREMHISDEIIKRVADTYRRLRNTARYLLASLHDFNPQQDLLRFDQLLDLDKWILEQASLKHKDILNAYNSYEFHLIYQTLHQFCVNQLGGFYLDVIKDRQYTLPAIHLARRSAQTAIYHLIEYLVRWFAPILSFTADEIWQFIPSQRSDSVLLETWYDAEFSDQNSAKRQESWQEIMTIRDAINKQLESARRDNIIGSSLESELDLYVDQELQQRLLPLQNELHFVMQTSAVRIHEISTRSNEAIATDLENLYIEIQASKYQKCSRCWHHHPSIGKDEIHTEICVRCIGNITDHPEERKIA